MSTVDDLLMSGDEPPEWPSREEVAAADPPDVTDAPPAAP